MIGVTLAALLTVAAPGATDATAATPAPASNPGRATATAVDPERLAIARTTVDHIWPLGTYQRMMSGMMLDQIMNSVFDMKLGDIVPEDKMSDEEKESETTMAEAIAKKDPHFRERMRIFNDVMMTEIGTVMTKVEPGVRDALAHAYAKKFDARQLTDINRFFSTPTGSVYASESMILFMSPEMMKAIMAATPEMMKAMPSILEKIDAATAHLPKPPKDDAAGEENGEAEAESRT